MWLTKRTCAWPTRSFHTMRPSAAACLLRERLPVVEGVRIGGMRNPLQGPATIEYSLPEAGRVVIEIHDVAGRIVCRLLDALQSSGSHSVKWSAREENGLELPAGVYWLTVGMVRHGSSRKLVVLK